MLEHRVDDVVLGL
jgi:hypothetical protein